MAELPSNSSSEDVLSEYEKIELQGCYSAITSFLNKRIQLIAVFGGANLTLLGLAFKNEQAGLLLAAALVLVIFAIADSMSRVHLICYLYRSYLIEKKQLRDFGLIQMHIAIHGGGLKLLRVFQSLQSVEDRIEVAKKLRRKFMNPFSFRGWGVLITVLFVSSLEIAISLVVHFNCKWPFF